MIEDLTVVCITRAEDSIISLLNQMSRDAERIGAEFVLAGDGEDAVRKLSHLCSDHRWLLSDLIQVESKGYIESVHDSVMGHIWTRYVLRLDDDESVSASLLKWLMNGQYRDQPHWKFPRAHLWDNDQTVIVNAPLWEDHQTRLSIKQMSTGRSGIHCGSPFGGGELCPCPIIHHKFLVKSIWERQAIRQRYNKIHPGAGENFLPFSVPEDYYSGEYDLRSLKEVDNDCRS